MDISKISKKDVEKVLHKYSNELITNDFEKISNDKDAYNIITNVLLAKGFPILNYVNSIWPVQFVYNNELKNIDIPNNIISLGESCFYGCHNLEHIQLPNSITKLPIECFAFCRSLKEIVIPNSVRILQSGCFAGCVDLLSVTLPDSIERISSNAFGDLDALQEDLVINCKEGSYAYLYAKEYGIPVKCI